MRITHISDTHNKHKQLDGKLPGGVLLIHSGDISSLGRKNEVEQFIKWFGKQDYTHKVFIAGNHDMTFDREILLRDKLAHFEGRDRNDYDTECAEGKPEWLVEMLDNLPDNVYYLENNSIKLEGINIWGSPYSARFGREWAFNVNRGEDSRELWGTIPPDANIIVTHGPLFGVVDRTNNNMNVGCEDLRETVMNLEPDFHLCGHIHEARGYVQFGKTHCINGSNLSLSYEYKHKPITFDYNFETKEIEFI